MEVIQALVTVIMIARGVLVLLLLCLLHGCASVCLYKLPLCGSSVPGLAVSDYGESELIDI